MHINGGLLSHLFKGSHTCLVSDLATFIVAILNFKDFKVDVKRKGLKSKLNLYKLNL